MVEVERAGCGHAFVFGENDLRVDSAHRPRRRHNDDFVQTGQHRIAGQQQDGPPLVGGSANVCQRILPRRTELLPTLAFPS
jgi:hypothetical protein